MRKVGSGPVYLGVDTGGTYTDAVLWSEHAGVIAKAKALTTRNDLSCGIAKAIDNIFHNSEFDAGRIKLVSLSTTLATNALVEGQGRATALVAIGFALEDISRAGLAKALGSDPLILCPGGHDAHGRARDLNLDVLQENLPRLAKTVSGIAIASHFAIRNPEHEIMARDMIRSETVLPVTCSHELSNELNGPRRALTALLNARLISLIESLIDSAEYYLKERGIHAPVMIVRGDGALVSAEFAREKPIETILSGPAASLVGARYLLGAADAIVSDIGGTTTDVGILYKGQPRLDIRGAMVGGMRTMVKAVAMRTFGLGGDSEVVPVDRDRSARITIGPRRSVPLALAAFQHDGIRLELRRQLKRDKVAPLDGRFVCRTGLSDKFAEGLSKTERRTYDRIPDYPVPLAKIQVPGFQIATLDSLRSRDLIQIIGFTPSDAAHVLERQNNWNTCAARMGAELLARRKDHRGCPIASNGRQFSEIVLETVARRSAESVLETALEADGLDGTVVRGRLVQRALDRRPGNATYSLGLSKPLIGLGASAPLHYASLSDLLGKPCHFVAHGEVANAIGAVVSHVRMTATVRVSQPQVGLYRVEAGSIISDFDSEDTAITTAGIYAREMAAELATRAGAVEAVIETNQDSRFAVIEGDRCFVEAFVIAVASGRPRIAD